VLEDDSVQDGVFVDEGDVVNVCNFVKGKVCVSVSVALAVVVTLEA
jgi:hypothetical protein